MDVLYQRCGGELVQSVSVQRVESTRRGEVTGPVLWKVESQRGSEIDRFTVGQQPPEGFETVVALAGPVPNEPELAVSVVTSRFEGTIDVRLQDVEAGAVYHDGKNLDRARFQKVISDN